MEVFDLIFLLVFHFKTHFYMACISFQEYTKMFYLDGITNKNNKNDDKKWLYRMLIVEPSGSGKTNALLNLIQK